MPKQKSVFICQSCAYESPHWVGQCPQCLSWNSFEETDIVKPAGLSKRAVPKSAKPIKLSSVKAKQTRRTSSGVHEFDRVLGGGFVPGQVIIIAGEPGVGKSTLLTQIAKNMDSSKILYVCGEESVSQIKLRAQRMSYPANNLLMLPITDVDEIVSTILNAKDISLVIVDSIQTLTSMDLRGMAGSIGQVRGSTQKLTDTAKKCGIPVILVGHITKEGAVAGPKVLEHIVDTVLYLGGDSQHLFRMLKTTKNRFGPVSEIGIFEMKDSGMYEVQNPSQLFLEQLTKSPGSCITVVMEGFRPLLFEIQALTTRTSFGYPRRTASGFNANRLQVLIAILEKRCRLNLSSHDVYLSVAGGFKVVEYACDLAVCLAIASSIKDKPIKKGVVAFGECGLAGEVRKVVHQKSRAKEAEKMGFSTVIAPDTVKFVNQAFDLAF
jgi:DNA repair protein RadA/Sms